MRTVYYVGGFVAVSVGVGYLLSLEQAATEPLDPEADLTLIDNGELPPPLDAVPVLSLADQIGGMLKTMVPYAAGAIGVDAALAVASKGAQKGAQRGLVAASQGASQGALAKYGVGAIGKLGGSASDSIRLEGCTVPARASRARYFCTGAAKQLPQNLVQAAVPADAGYMGSKSSPSISSPHSSAA
ncbi:hypothetical protein T492DRAFT_1152111 [Pavlovales sp. CCMP2436]|nr:hypothetical protein T492DRAFT_1152111 [Pavlovales sp. CCMP2436]